MDEFLRAQGPRHFLLLGEPGCGTSASLADLVRERGYPDHFVGRGSRLGAGDSPDWHRPVRLAESLGYHLLRDHGGWVLPWDDWGLGASVVQKAKELDGLLVGAHLERFDGVPRIPAIPGLRKATSRGWSFSTANSETNTSPPPATRGSRLSPTRHLPSNGAQACGCRDTENRRRWLPRLSWGLPHRCSFARHSLGWLAA